MNKIRSLKEKTRSMRRQSSYNSMSQEPTLKFGNQKDSRLSKPKIISNMMIPAVFRHTTNKNRESKSIMQESKEKISEFHSYKSHIFDQSETSERSRIEYSAKGNINLYQK